MHVVPETVYQTLYGRGSLDLAVDPAIALRSGRTGRRPRRRKEHRTKRFPEMVMIRDRPAEVISRLVPGHGRGSNYWKRWPICHRHVSRTNNPLHCPRASGRQPRRRQSPRPAGSHNGFTSGPSPPFPDVGPGHRNGLPSRFHPAHTHTHPRLLLRPRQSMAARVEREHQRPAPAVLPERHRLECPQSRTPRPGCC
mgnify:CR=1 FL=1